MRKPIFANVPSGSKTRARTSIGGQYLQTARHHQRGVWYKVQYWSKAPFAVSKVRGTPRILLDRSLYHSVWNTRINNPDVNRWEKVVNSMRVTEDRYALVEEEGMMHRINWKMYCKRVESELESQKQQLPQYTVRLAAAPSSWKKLHLSCCAMRDLSVREAMAQCKLSNRKGHQIIFRALEKALQGAEGKGLEKDKLRIGTISCTPGATDKQIDIRSKGYYAWKTKRSTNLLLTVVEDPDLVLPDRSAIPYSSMLTMRRAGLREEATVLDVPAITAEGI
jgi:ribosomal protein L22